MNIVYMNINILNSASIPMKSIFVLIDLIALKSNCLA